MKGSMRVSQDYAQCSELTFARITNELANLGSLVEGPEKQGR